MKLCIACYLVLSLGFAGATVAQTTTIPNWCDEPSRLKTCLSAGLETYFSDTRQFFLPTLEAKYTPGGHRAFDRAAVLTHLFVCPAGTPPHSYRINRSVMLITCEKNQSELPQRSVCITGLDQRAVIKAPLLHSANNEMYCDAGAKLKKLHTPLPEHGLMKILTSNTEDMESCHFAELSRQLNCAHWKIDALRARLDELTQAGDEETSKL